MFDAHTVSLISEESSLTFDEKVDLVIGKTGQFVKSIKSVMQRHRTHDGVDEFVIRYFLHDTYFHCLDEWLHSAIS